MTGYPDIKRKVLIIALTLTIMLTVASCTKNKNIVKSRRYSFELKTWGMPGTESFEAFMYNTGQETYPPDRRWGIEFRQNTLYILRHQYLNNQRVTDTVTVEMHEEQVDSLYSLAYQYLSNFEMDNKIDTEKVYEIIHDGASISVGLGLRGKLMQCSQYRLKGVSSASSGGSELVEFVNRNAPEGFKVY